MKGSLRGANNEERKCKMAHEKCATCKRSSKADGWVVCANCLHNNSRKDRYEPMTNADRIRNMTDEELVDVIHCPLVEVDGCHTGKSCALCILRWLRSPANDGGNEK